MKQSARHFVCAGIAGFMLFVATPAGAQHWRAVDKSDAILGAPSSLAAIIATQSGTTSLLAALPLTSTDLGQGPLPALAPIVEPTPPASDTAAALDRPDVFNSVAVPIAITPLDGRWRRVEASTVGGKAGRFAAALRGRDQRAKLDAVNRYVNAGIRFVDDSRQFGVADRWETANKSLASGRGDCEDYAIAKLAMLRRAGFADRDLYFVVLKDLARRADHAVLVVRSEGRFLVLDNGTEKLLYSAAIRDYRPVLTFSAGQRFTHGYRRSSSPPVVLASGGTTGATGKSSIATAAGSPSSSSASR